MTNTCEQILWHVLINKNNQKIAKIGLQTVGENISVLVKKKICKHFLGFTKFPIN